MYEPTNYVAGVLLDPFIVACVSLLGRDLGVMMSAGGVLHQLNTLGADARGQIAQILDLWQML